MWKAVVQFKQDPGELALIQLNSLLLEKQANVGGVIIYVNDNCIMWESSSCIEHQWATMYAEEVSDLVGMGNGLAENITVMCDVVVQA